MKKKKIQNNSLKKSSRDWILRQINDPYVILAKKKGYRSRAAFKLLEIQEKFKIIKKDSIVIDLGSSPGGWSQIASEITKNIIAIDLLDMENIPNVKFIKGDFLEESVNNELNIIFAEKKADVILSDMAPSTCGIKKVDHIRIMNLTEEVLYFSEKSLKIGGNLVVKVFQGGLQSEFSSKLKQQFNKISYFKPKSSRKESSELYLVAIGFKKISLL